MEIIKEVQKQINYPVEGSQPGYVDFYVKEPRKPCDITDEILETMINEIDFHLDIGPDQHTTFIYKGCEIEYIGPDSIDFNGSIFRLLSGKAEKLFSNHKEKLYELES